MTPRHGWRHSRTTRLRCMNEPNGKPPTCDGSRRPSTWPVRTARLLWSSSFKLRWGYRGSAHDYTPLVTELAESRGRVRQTRSGAQWRFAPLQSRSAACGSFGAIGMIHKTQDVPNLTRIVVQGALTADGNNPRKWLRLTIDPRAPAVFSWENVSYCEASPGPGSTLPACPSKPSAYGGVGAVPAPRSDARPDQPSIPVQTRSTRIP